MRSEGDDTRTGQSAPQRSEHIVGVDDGGRARSEPGDHLAFRARHRLETAETLEMLGAGVGDEPDGRLRHFHERRYFARLPFGRPRFFCAVAVFSTRLR